jgi:ParB-like chromosome segregation protein Spo0J
VHLYGLEQLAGKKNGSEPDAHYQEGREAPGGSLMRQLERFSPDAISACSGRRSVCESKVEALAESIKQIGLRTPITVRLVDGFVDVDGVVVDGQPVLVTGNHRLHAVRKLGWEKVECYIFDGDSDLDAELWEIDENLCRHELSATEQSEHKAKRKELWEAREKAAQVEPPEIGYKQPPPQSEGFATETAKATGKSKASINRAIKRAHDVCQEARDLIRNTKLDTGAMLDRLAKVSPEEQVAYVQDQLDVIRDKERRDALRAEREQRDAEARRLREEARMECCNFLCTLMNGRDWARLIDMIDRAGGSISAKQLRDWQSP